MFPAPAGINRQPFSIAGVSKSVPRASGDKPEKLLLCSTDALCSPRQRG
ncbi:hypothetical protein AD16_2672 [Escherichia coli 3-267-03_S4_C2]|nr:hypothetical protein UMNF18_3561 [Escherichia coli UMNF18]EHV69077.1 hypothetical protein ECDEC6D_3300 [Escherichia coli DEC6D]EHV71416.1 hypothetical protein ECDEC6E_3271 [Escherichia coli DEC6E]KDU24929.1 hypothetical protein AD16_2672 [Escherichia coli 3-267-03_S4_C2]KDV99771.1 hypothetical protein AB85_3237 [Escherichia coli 2-156-04_S3_C1]KDW47366.1 hypothetical protein AC97_0167 [Escherichia coli 2-177-06_S4_C2]KDZ77908.1 hypothetical protein AD42_5061 [Escherichia coli 3-073-06_S4_C